jgi:CubicO group peptidase (beta-lactamase class C family)
MTSEVAVGLVAPGFERVKEEFERNFAECSEVGAAFAAVRDGELVVDLWGGVADEATGRRWEEDTLQVVFSGTKGFVGPTRRASTGSASGQRGLTAT